MRTIFGEEGILKEILHTYEFRDVQLQMAECVADVLEQQEIALIEAGTGTGKTLAYLVPALAYCCNEGKVLAVSTETKSLQKQLIDKDIPLLKQVLREKYQLECKVSLCLGSSNYPCQKRFEAMVQKGGFLFGEQEGVELLREKFADGQVFSRYDIEVKEALWHEVRRDPELCNLYRCAFSRTCIFQKAKKEWAASTLLIMNHYLFFTNIAIGKTYLPHFDVLIFDEAHSLEAIASSQLGFVLSRDAFNDIIRLFHVKKKERLLSHFREQAVKKQAYDLLSEVEKTAKYFFEIVDKNIIDSVMQTIRLHDGLAEGVALCENIGTLLSFLEHHADDFTSEDLRIELDAARNKLFSFRQHLNMVVYGDEDNWIYWIEKEAGTHNRGGLVKGQPVDISEIMRHDVYAYYETLLFVSATLAVNKDFRYIKKSLGIFDEARSLILESPFDYKSQVLLYLPRDIVPPSDEGYVRAACERSIEVITLLQGNCLLLFTSYDMLQKFKTVLDDAIDFPIFAQGDYDPIIAVQKYREQHNSILMGTHSYWQGLDLPGDLLRGVIVTRLPFGVPDRPDIEARIERYQQAGKNPFMHFQIPRAVIRFKQGFGRLIRSSGDKGVVTVLDSRITQKSYGRIFLNSLPRCTMTHLQEDVAAFVEAVMLPLS